MSFVKLTNYPQSLYKQYIAIHLYFKYNILYHGASDTNWFNFCQNRYFVFIHILVVLESIVHLYFQNIMIHNIKYSLAVSNLV